MRNGSSFLIFQNTVSSNVIGCILEFRTHQSKYCLCLNKYKYIYIFKKNFWGKKWCKFMINGKVVLTRNVIPIHLQNLHSMPAKLLNCVPNEEKKHLEQLHPPISAVSTTVPSPNNNFTFLHAVGIEWKHLKLWAIIYINFFQIWEGQCIPIDALQTW